MQVHTTKTRTPVPGVFLSRRRSPRAWLLSLIVSLDHIFKLCIHACLCGNEVLLYYLAVECVHITMTCLSGMYSQEPFLDTLMTFFVLYDFMRTVN